MLFNNLLEYKGKLEVHSFYWKAKVPYYEFQCEVCGNKTVRSTASIRESVPSSECCGNAMLRIWNPTSFKITGYTSRNSFSKGDDGWMEKTVSR